MSVIPGLSIFATDSENSRAIEIEGITKTFTVPNRFGECKPFLDFEKLEKIEEGTFGILYKCRNKKTKEVYSLRKFKMPSDENGIPISIPREVTILKQLKHINIVNSHGIVAGANLYSNYILLDYCVYSLNDLILKNVEPVFGKPVMKNILKQLFRGIEHIHAATVIHRDICCENIRFSPTGIVKITGFQIAKYFKLGDLPPSPDVCHIRYCAPEILLGAELCTPAVDMWSIGCIFARLLLKNFLFQGETEVEVLKDIFNILGNPSEDIWPGYTFWESKFCKSNNVQIKTKKEYNELGSIFGDNTPACVDIIQKLLVYFPSARLNAEACLKHMYFMENPQDCLVEDVACVLKKVEEADKSNIKEERME